MVTRTKVKAVVVGAKECGKTSLITSLYSNLLMHGNSKDFDLGEWKVSRFIREEPDDPHVFDFKGACNRLKNCRYPLQTKDWSVIKMEVHLSKVNPPSGWLKGIKKVFTAQKKIVSLEMLDLPGERLSDLALMVEEKFKRATFRKWSLRVEGAYKSIDKSENSKWKSYAAYLDEVKEILEHLTNDLKEIDESGDDKSVKAKRKDGLNKQCKSRILEAYKKFLPLLRESRVVYYAPSTIRLTEDGKLVPARSAEGFHDSLMSGLKVTEDGKLTPLAQGEESKDTRKIYIGLAEDEFAPLPREAFEDDKYKGLRDSFEDSYNKYYKQIVAPIVERLKDTQKVYYLVDVLNLLRDGREKTDAEKRFAESFFKVLGRRPSTVPLIAGMIDTCASLFTSVKKVFLVATQADKVLICKNLVSDEYQKKIADDNLKNMKELTKSLAMNEIQDAMGEDVEVQTDVCAAINSTKATEDGRLAAYWESDPKAGISSRELGQPPPVPKSWPDLDSKWEPAETFKYERPKRCLRSVDPGTTPLQQFNVAAIAKSLLGI